jgi:hypothetical protein
LLIHYELLPLHCTAAMHQHSSRPCIVGPVSAVSELVGPVITGSIPRLDSDHILSPITINWFTGVSIMWPVALICFGVCGRKAITKLRLNSPILRKHFISNSSFNHRNKLCRWAGRTGSNLTIWINSDSVGGIPTLSDLALNGLFIKCVCKFCCCLQKMVCHGEHTYLYSQVVMQTLAQESKGGSNIRRLCQELQQCATEKFVSYLNFMTIFALS